MKTSEAPSWASPSSSINSGAAENCFIGDIEQADDNAQDEQSTPTREEETEEWSPPNMTSENDDPWSADSDMPISTKRTLPHRIYRFFKGIIIILSLLLLIAQIVSVVYLPFTGIELLLKFFLGSFSILIVLIELEWGGKLITGSALLTNWMSRGYFYAFVGLVSLEENNLQPTTASLSTLPFDYSAALFIETSSTMMFVAGCCYGAFGLCCGQRYMNKVRSDYKKRLSDKKKMFENGSDTKGLMS